MTCPRSYSIRKKVPALAPLFNACLPILLSPLLLPPLTHHRPGTPGYHSRGARPGPGCSCGNWQGTGELLFLSTSQPWPNPSLPAPTCCQGSPPQEGWPPHSDPLLWILPAGSEVWGVGLPPAGLPGKMEEALNHRGSWICSLTSTWTHLTSCQPLYHQFPDRRSVATREYSDTRFFFSICGSTNCLLKSDPQNCATSGSIHRRVSE